MKTTMILALMSIFACMTVNAENEELNNTATEPEANSQEVVMNTTEAEQTTEAQSVENGLLLQYPNIITESNVESMMSSSSKKDEGYRQDRYWKRGRNLRTIGIITTVVGTIGSPLWLVLGGKEMDDAKNVGEGIASVNHTFAYAALGGAVIVGGIVMWAIGNSNMRHARLSYTGNGVAYNF